MLSKSRVGRFSRNRSSEKIARRGAIWKRLGSRAIVSRSRCLVIAQNGRACIPSGSYHETGACVRKNAHEACG